MQKRPHKFSFRKDMVELTRTYLDSAYQDGVLEKELYHTYLEKLYFGTSRDKMTIYKLAKKLAI